MSEGGPHSLRARVALLVHALANLALAQRHDGLAYQKQQGKHECGVYGVHCLPLICTERGIDNVGHLVVSLHLRMHRL